MVGVMVGNVVVFADVVVGLCWSFLLMLFCRYKIITLSLSLHNNNKNLKCFPYLV